MRAVCRVSSVALSLLLALTATACGVLSPEEQLLMDFFEASRLHDTTAVAKVSSVTFNPRTDGIVQEFEVEDVAEEGVTKRVTVRAPVRQFDGSVSMRTLIFTMTRKDERWFIVGLQ